MAMNSTIGKWGRRRWIVLGIVILFLLCAKSLGLTPAGLVPPDETRWERAGAFFKAALSPAMDYQDENVPEDAPPI